MFAMVAASLLDAASPAGFAAGSAVGCASMAAAGVGCVQHAVRWMKRAVSGRNETRPRHTNLRWNLQGQAWQPDLKAMAAAFDGMKLRRANHQDAAASVDGSR